jgi:uncharacterized protein YndB with AHSA1/START domain
MNNEQGVTITRIFDAPVESVWNAWTQPELVQKWWGPEGFTAPSITIDFQVGGKYVYAMQGPAGSEWDKVMYSAGVYKEIVPQQKLVVTDYFSDENGNMMNPADFGQDANFPKESTITVLFEAIEPDKTKLSIIYPKPTTEAEFEAMKNSGMQEGWSSSLDKLAKIL